MSDAERKQLEAAYDFLLRTRTELHYHLNRPMDVLGKNLQPAVAPCLGWHDRSPSQRIEKFMRELYTHMRNIFLITRTLEQRMALVPEKPSRLSLRAWLPKRKPPAPVDGFIFVDGEIRAASNRIFRDDPRRLMRVFLHAQQRRLQLHPDLAQLIRSPTLAGGPGFLNDEHVRETFLTILERRGEVAPILRAMHEVNLLGKYLPEFGKLTCLVQHEFYHQYAADEHTLVCLEQLDKIWEAQQTRPTIITPRCFSAWSVPVCFTWRCCCTMSARPAHHKKAATPKSAPKWPCAPPSACGWTNRATHMLRVLIENHLLMAAVSQRRDLDDPSVIRDFARQD